MRGQAPLRVIVVAGQIASQTDDLSGEQITYQYDALKRLYSASASAWTQGSSGETRRWTLMGVPLLVPIP